MIYLSSQQTNNERIVQEIDSQIVSDIADPSGKARGAPRSP